MFEFNQIKDQIQDLFKRINILINIFDFHANKKRLKEINIELNLPEI